MLLNINPTRDLIIPDIDKRVIEYHKVKNAISLEKGDQRNEPNNGLLSIGASLLRCKHEVEYFDLNAKEVKYFNKTGAYFSSAQIVKLLEKKVEDLDFMLISALSPSINNAFKIASITKTVNPKCIIMLGGIFPTMNSDYCVKNGDNVDVVVIGDGEIIVPKIIEAYSENDFSLLDDAKGIIYKIPDKSGHIVHHGHNIMTDLDLIDDFAYELLRDECKPYVYRVFTARGCTLSCSFCSPSFVNDHKLRKLSPDRIIQSILRIKNKFDAEYFLIGDLNFFDDEEHSRQILKQIIEANVNLPFWCQTRLDKINSENIKLLADAGCTQIAVGLESYDNMILSNANKNIYSSEIQNKLILVKDNGIEVQGYFIVGFPGETPESFDRTSKFIENAIKKGFLDITHISIYTPYPGIKTPKGVHILDDNYNNYHQGVFLDMPPEPVYETNTLGRKLILDLWLELLERITFAYLSRP